MAIKLSTDSGELQLPAPTPQEVTCRQPVDGHGPTPRLQALWPKEQQATDTHQGQRGNRRVGTGPGPENQGQVLY